MTVVSSTPYSPQTFHKALSIHAAGAAFKARDVDNFITNTLAPIIKQHDMESQFGVGLVHRHFNLEENEILVEFNNISTPWPCKPGSTTTEADFNSLIYPVAWMLQENDGGEQKWMPYEFAFSPVAGKDSHVVELDNTTVKQEFLSAFTAALTKAGLQDLLGLRAWPGSGFRGTLEFTEGRTNINLVSGQYELVEGKAMGYTDTMWFYDPEFALSNCRCVCRYNTKGFHTLNHLGHRYFPPTKGDRHIAVK